MINTTSPEYSINPESFQLATLHTYVHSSICTFIVQSHIHSYIQMQIHIQYIHMQMHK